MIVQFEIDLPDGNTISESDLAHAGDGAQAAAEMDSPEGGLVLNNPATGQSTAMGDMLGALINRFCFESIAKLAAGQEYAIHLFQYPEKVSMKPEGDDVLVTGDEIDPSRYPKRELLPALVACGERYAAYLRKTHGSDPSWAGRLAAVDSAAKAARAQLPR